MDFMSLRAFDFATYSILAVCSVSVIAMVLL